jgi:hypothetical protein
MRRASDQDIWSSASRLSHLLAYCEYDNERSVRSICPSASFSSKTIPCIWRTMCTGVLHRIGRKNLILIQTIALGQIFYITALLSANKSFGHVATFKNLGTRVTNENYIREKIKSRLKCWNTCYHSIQRHLPISSLKS